MVSKRHCGRAARIPGVAASAQVSGRLTRGTDRRAANPQRNGPPGMPVGAIAHALAAHFPPAGHLGFPLRSGQLLLGRDRRTDLPA